MPTIPLSQNRLKFALDLFLPKQVSEHGKKTSSLHQATGQGVLPYFKATRQGVFYVCWYCFMLKTSFLHLFDLRSNFIQGEICLGVEKVGMGVGLSAKTGELAENGAW